MEIFKMVGLSTAHLKATTRLWLSESIHAISAYEKEGYGWFVPILPDSGEFYTDYPNDLINAIKYARTQGFDWIMFDHDIPYSEQLPLYDAEISPIYSCYVGD